MKSFKKVAALLLSCVMVLAFTVMASAAQSPVAEDTDCIVVVPELDFNGNTAEQEAAQSVKADPQAVLDAAGVSGDYTFIDVFDIHHELEDGTYDPDYPGTVVKTVPIDGVKAEDKIVVLHYLDETDTWVQETVLSVEDGQVVVQSANGCSPFAFYKSTGSSASDSSSPKTGAMPVAGLLAVAALAGLGMFISRKKSA